MDIKIESKYGSSYSERNIVGYGADPPDPQWPNGAKVALNIVVNYEEGAESCLLHGDDASEALLTDIVGCSPRIGERNTNMESLYDYGSRAGFWRLQRLFERKQIRVTVFACGMALEQNPEAGLAMKNSGWEIASHGYRWIDYRNVSEATESQHIQKTVKVHEDILGHRPIGIYQGTPNVNTRKLIMRDPGFLYDSDSYADDLPYWNLEHGRPHLIIPYTLSENDMKFVTPGGFANADQFASHLRATLDYLLQESEAGYSKMMNVGLHCRLARPGRVSGVDKFLDHVLSYGNDVWVCRRDEIARHWYQNHWNPSWGEAPEVPIYNAIG